MKMKKVVAMTLVTAMTVSMIAGCGTAKEEKKDTKPAATETTEKTEKTETTEKKEEKPAVETATSKKAAEKVAKGNDVTIKTVSMFGGTDPNAVIYQAINSKFMEQHPNVTIEDDSQVSNEEWKAKVAADFAVGNEPDVLQFFVDATANPVVATDKLVSLEEIQKEYPEYAADTIPEFLDTVKNADGVKRAVPTTGYWEGLFCNKDLFDKYNVALPTDWTSFTKAVETFKENKIIPVACSLMEVPHYWIEYCMLYAAGPEEYTKIPTTAPEGWVKGLKVIEEMRTMGAFSEDTDTVDNAYVEELFNSKQAAMQLDGNWRMNGITDKENVVVVNFPGVPDQKAEAGSVVSGLSSGFYITKSAWDDPDRRDAAVKFVMAQTCKDSLLKYWNGSGVATCEVTDVADMNPLQKSGLDYSNAAKALYLPTDSRISTYKALIPHIAAMSNGKEDPKVGIDEMLQLYKDGATVK